tara:strand:- start:73 stop:783 length:711 start_codon:yes stop_codon:yes gene_type:complete
MKKKFLCLILARGNSTRLKNKNILNFYGKPLIYYTIKAAKDSKIFDKIIVSTDNKKIAKISKEFGAEVPFLRPKNLSTKYSNALDAVVHALKYIKRKKNIYDYVQYIFPTNPLRDKSDILKGYIEVKKNPSLDLVISVSKSKKCGFTINKLNKAKSLKNFVKKKYRLSNRQEFPNTYFIDGSIYLGKWDVWYKKKDWFSVHSKAIITPDEKSVDIDDEFDFRLAKYKFKLLKNRIR